MDSKKHKKILREDLVPEATVLIDRGIPVKVQHDNAPCHSSATIRKFIVDNGIEFLDWPPYSPELNVKRVRSNEGDWARNLDKGAIEAIDWQ
jgi:hypothetical protein